MDRIMEILWEVMVNGIIIIAGGTVLITFVCANYFKKASSGTAFVRTGAAGTLVVCDGGAMVLPLYQEVTPVGLGCHKISVCRLGREAFLDRDGMPIEADIHAYVRVQPEIGGILSASRTLGSLTMDNDSMLRIMSPRVASVLREAIASRTWKEIQNSQDAMKEEMRDKTQEAVGCNGLVLDYLALTTLRPVKSREVTTSAENGHANGAVNPEFEGGLTLATPKKIKVRG
ncbi:MAG: hypothetical protein CVV64_12140 [Candidatus Wallbacteria bacterium HGW-Wallbacteria-1]|jgi:uncharacterized membrane protein YqiK|uniref:Band 7 domain-containing protein n=1 Tax=Candidatus Wallbacteria bacterium HGW-Wallbacteria-1 TaxID=2013854 RepID=A0A2N1PNJ0_9BACT|nr:MAG: hypothetical protein CVV64_12140 [Candidatus Wallbacteria bacterium HGW-Wallbacteria-1]